VQLVPIHDQALTISIRLINILLIRIIRRRLPCCHA
jgi:hypothetical protein